MMQPIDDPNQSVDDLRASTKTAAETLGTMILTRMIYEEGGAPEDFLDQQQQLINQLENNIRRMVQLVIQKEKEQDE